MSTTITIVTDPCCEGSGSAAGRRNSLINGGCIVAQRNDATISGSYLFGATDRWAGKAAGSPSAGTLTRASSAPIGRTGYALMIDGLTTGSSGSASIRYRMESADARAFRNQTAVFNCLVHHDVGSDIAYSVTISKADAVDDFSSVTAISTQSFTVADQTEHRLIHSTSLGDVTNGLEIVVTAECGAITTKDFYFTEMQLEGGSTPTTFDYRSIAEELNLCLRYAWMLRPHNDGGVRFGLGQCVSTTAGQMWLPFPTTMRVGPTVSISAAGDFALANTTSVNMTMTSFATTNSYSNGAAFNAICSGGGLVAGHATQWFAVDPDSFILFDSEL